MQLVWFPFDHRLRHVQTCLTRVHRFDKPPASVRVCVQCLHSHCLHTDRGQEAVETE
jgi:hypothetical protein